MALTIDDAVQQMLARGIEPPPPQLAADGKKITWAGDARRPKKKNAWAVLHEWVSPRTSRSFIVGRYGIRDEHWAIEPTQQEWSPAERLAWQEKRKALEREAEADRDAAAALCRDKAARLWKRAAEEGASEYLQRKQVGAYGVRFAFRKVLVPVADLAGTLHGLQWIGPEGDKVFGTGTVKEGHFHLIGQVADGQPIAFGEGYATCASAFMATAWPVVVCFDAGNLAPVMVAWRKLYPDHAFMILADDDRHLVQRLCERLHQLQVSVEPAFFARSAGGVRDSSWTLADGSTVALKARWAKDRADVFHIEGSIEAAGVTQLLRLENAGRAKAFAAAKRHSARVLLPRFADRAARGTDFNDLHVDEGLDVVRAQLLAPPEEPQASRKPASGRRGGGSDDGAGPERLRFPYVTDKWEVRGIRENVYFALRMDPELQGLVGYNEFSQRIDKARAAPWGGHPSQWQPMDDLRLANYLAEAHGLIVANPVTLEQAVLMAAQDLAYNPVRDDFESTEWDGTARLEEWLIRGMGAADNAYTRAAGPYFLLSLVARVCEPGCQMDYMLVLQGAQGAGKSSALRILGGEFYAGGHFRIGDKEAMQALQGVLIFNFNELDSLGKAENSAIKGFITERADYFRPPYAKSFASFPRCCVLTGDTNQGEFLRDATGDRRFWVVQVGAVDLEYMRRERQQLLAEAMHLYRLGARRYPSREEERELFFPEQERWKVVDVWVDALARYVHATDKVADGFDGCGDALTNSERDYFSNQELMSQALHIDIAKIDRAGSMQRSLSNAMQQLGFRKHRWPKGRARPWGWQRVLASEQGPGAAQVPPTPAQPNVRADEVPAWQ
jgi:putative DNA primase/helicase